MRKWIIRVFLAFLLAVAVTGFAKREALIRLNAVNTLFAEDRIVNNFSHMDALFHSVTIPVSGTPEPLPQGAAMALPKDFADWRDRRAVTAIVVLKDGHVVHEDYYLGTKREDQRISWSVAKSYLSALFGIALENGAIESLDDPVTRYAPMLKGSAYDGATIRNVLQMASGVVFDEDYLDFWSDINKMGRVLALGGSMDAFAAGLTASEAAPGERWKYVSIDTHVLSMVLRGATGRSLPDLLGEYILTPLGAYGSPYYVTDGHGVAFALGGLNLTTRDYARMGEMTRLNGVLQGRRIVPEAWMIESTQASAPTADGAAWRYGYQWWIPGDGHDGEVLARGVYGQYVYVDRANGVVIALNGADRNFREDGAGDDVLQMLRRIATGLEANG